MRDENTRIFKLDSRGVSIVLVTLLIAIITVAAALLVYLWTIGVVGGLQGSGGQQVKDQLMMLRSPLFGLCI